jgi:prepilin-type N-terminal cleavage/methylation domain-containing protein
MSRRPDGRRARAGFSLIELLTVFVMLGVMAALTAGRISQVITRQRVNRAAIALSNDWQAAYALAQRDRKPMQIKYDSSKVQFSVQDRSGTVFRRLSLSSFNLTNSGVTMSRSSLEIYPVGLAQDSISVTLSETAGTTTYKHTVRMTRGGLVQVK